MKAYLCVAAVCLLFVAGTSAVDVSAAKSIVTQTRPITYSATTRIVNDLHAPDTSMQAARDVVFSDDANEAQNTPHQKVKRVTPLHALHQQVSMPAAGETGVTPIHRKKAAWNDEEIQRETIARVTQGIPQLLKQVDSNMHRVRERTLMEGVVNFLQTGEKVFEKETSKESPSQMLRRMKQQLEDLDRRRAKLETVRDSIKEELASKKSSFVARHHAAPRRRSSNDDDPVLVEAASVESPARPLADSMSLDLDVKDWADQARFKQQKNDINNLVTDADNALSSMSARLKLDYE